MKYSKRARRFSATTFCLSNEEGFGRAIRAGHVSANLTKGKAGTLSSDRSLVRSSERRATMPRGDKSSYTNKQKRKAEHIAEGYEDRGVPAKTAKSRAWATVNKESGGGNKSGSGRGKKDTHASSSRGGR